MGGWDSLFDSIDDSILIPRLSAWIKTNEFANPKPAVRAEGWHASSVGDFCARRHALIELNPKKKETEPDARLIRTFNVGHMHHQWYQERYLGPMGILWGEWVCRQCGTLYKGPMPRECNCNACDFHYMEMGIEVPELDLFGHTDGVLLIDGEYYLLEIKTKDATSHARLSEPDYDHLFQVNLYMGYLDLNRYAPMGAGVLPPVRKALVLYVSKNPQWGAAYEKEFVVEFRQDRFDRVTQQLGIVNAYLTSSDLSVIPERTLCEDLDSAKEKCPIAKVCFRE